MFPYLIAGAIGFVVAKLFEEDESPKYADGGSVLLAPNGKPSNLTPEQYKLVRTPEFKAWFGDWEKIATCQPYTYSKLEGQQNSMLLDENGEPQIFYHGSYNYGFTIVDVHGSSEQSLFWLSTSKEFARQFTGYKRFGYKDAQEYYDKDGTEFLTGIYSFFVKTNKIFDVFNYNQVKEVNKELAELVGTKYTHTYEGKNGLGMLIKRKVEYESKFDKSYYYNLESNDWKVVEGWENDMWIIGMLKELGYDCLTNDEGGVINIGFIGNPNQIKLADEMKDELDKVNEKTNTTFDGSNPDIRYAGGGEIEELKLSNKIESDAMGYDIGDYLYHITPVSNFNTIINKGFIPKNGISINNKPFENRLYFATSLISAYDLSVNFGSYRDDSDYVIFKIKSDCINDYEEDDLFAHGIYVDYKVSNKCIVGYVNANDLFNKFDDEDIENLYY